MKPLYTVLVALFLAGLVAAQAKPNETEIITTTKVPTGSVIHILVQQGDSIKEGGYWVRFEVYNGLHERYSVLKRICSAYTNETFAFLYPGLSKILGDTSYVIVKYSDLQEIASTKKKKKKLPKIVKINDAAATP